MNNIINKPLIKLEKVNKYYQSGDERIHALKDISLELPAQGLIFVLGESGCGKSTLLNLLGGLDKPEEGRILIEGADFLKFTSGELNNYLNSYLGFVFQEYNILKDLNLYDNIALPLEMQHISPKEIKERTNTIIDLVGLSELKKRKINQLSGGQRQRIAVARALIKNPKMIIADEPTGNLDSVTSATIFELLKNLSKDRLVLIVSHDEESAFLYGDRVIRIEDGMLVEDISAPFGESNHNALLPPTIDETLPIVKVESRKRVTSNDSSDALVLTKVSTPIKTSAKLALKNINHKKFRFILMTLICALSLAFFSFTLELNSDKIRENVYTSVDNGYLYADLLQKSELPADYVKTSIYDDYIGTSLGAGTYDQVKADMPDLTVHQYQSVNIPVASNRNLINGFYSGEIEYLSRFDTTNNYHLLAGRKIEDGYHEIMITDYLISMFKYFGIYQEAENYSDYIGRTLKLATDQEYKIVGIIDTNYEKYTSFMKVANISIDNKLNYPFINEYKLMNTVYLDQTDYATETGVKMPKMDLRQSNYEINLKNNNNYTSINNCVVTTNELTIRSIQKDSTSYYVVGRNVDHTKNEIVVTYDIYAKLFNLQAGEPAGWNEYDRAWRRVRNKTVTLNVQSGNQDPVQLSVTVVGICAPNAVKTIGISDTVMDFLFTNTSKNSSYLLAELSNFKNVAYRQFQNAYQKGYIIDTFKYREDIDSYEISPFINLLSKAGLFVFAVFTIGILWTIISLDIVDSKKEIGTFRSIGLSGAKVSFIFIFQTLIICFFAYIIGLVVGYYAIKIYDQTIMDNLQLIHLSMFTMTYRSPLLLIVFLLVITSVALVLPLAKIMRQRIIDVINEREDL